MNLSSSESKNKIETLDGLRGIAIFLVVWFHIWQLSWLSTRTDTRWGALDFDFIGRSGYFGVELFFFISAICLTFPWVRAHLSPPQMTSEVSNHSLNWSDYALSRAIKILPSYWLAIILILTFKIESFDNASDYFRHLLTHLFFIHNLFRDTYGSINGVFWSLGVEVQFYVLFPFLVIGFVRYPLRVASSMTLIAVCYRAWVIHSIPDDTGFWMNQLPGFLDLFAAGMLASYALMLPKRRLPWGWIVAASLGVLLLILFKADQIRYEMAKHSTWLILSRIGFAWGLLVLTVASHFAPTFWKRLLANPALVWLSTLSYNLYIWHQLLGRQLIRLKIPPSLTPDPHNDPKWQFLYTLLALAVSLSFASLITYGFERPLLKRKKTLRFIKKSHIVPVVGG